MAGEPRELADTQAYSESTPEAWSRDSSKRRRTRPQPSLERFVKLVSANRLVPRSILSALVSGSRFQSYVGARDFAAHLVEGGHLTRWQAGRLLAGQSGFRLGKYKLVDRIGAGGMGVVLKAEHVHMRKIVAIKVLSRTLLRNETAVRRFYREVEAAAALDHPNIVRALDADCIDGIPFLVMEYVEGKDLGTLVGERGPLPVELACEFCRQAAVGLQHAWDRELVHRDVKPANLLLTRRSPQHPLAVKILDFGLARFASETPTDGEITSRDRIMGTVDFIAPEQARNARSADVRSDVYSLGCTLYFLLAARPAFEGENAMEKLASRLLGSPTPITRYRPDLPERLVDVVERMLTHDPQKRVPDHATVVSELDRFAAAEAIASVKSALKTVPRDEEGVGKYPSELALEHFLGTMEPTIDDDGSDPQAITTDTPGSVAGRPLRRRWSWRMALAAVLFLGLVVVVGLLPRFAAWLRGQ